MEMAFALLAAHALCDFALQPDAMGRGKSRRRQRESPPPADFPPWYYWLASHSLVHGGAVYIVTGMWWLGAIESLLHAMLDHLKCEGRISFHLDQICHLLCKGGYLVVLL